MGPRVAIGWLPLLAELGLRPIPAGGLTIYPVPAALSDPVQGEPAWLRPRTSTAIR
jgi:hypothetical protein